MLRRNSCAAIALLGMAAAGVAVAGMVAAASGQEPGPGHRVAPIPAVVAPIAADNVSCAGICQAKHDHCRVSTRDRPDCDTARQHCLQACLARKAR